MIEQYNIPLRLIYFMTARTFYHLEIRKSSVPHSYHRTERKDEMSNREFGGEVSAQVDSVGKDSKSPLVHQNHA